MTNSCNAQASRLVIFLVPFLAIALPVMGQGAAQQTHRTVSWYAEHQRERAQMQLACIDDPGHLGNSPDCVNAQKASVEVALREARAHTGTMNPRDPAFWSADPQSRRNLLLLCRHTPSLENCDVAKRSLQIEAGEAPR